VNDQGIISDSKARLIANMPGRVTHAHQMPAKLILESLQKALHGGLSFKANHSVSY